MPGRQRDRARAAEDEVQHERRGHGRPEREEGRLPSRDEDDPEGRDDREEHDELGARPRRPPV